MTSIWSAVAWVCVGLLVLFCNFFGYAEDSRYFCVYLSWVARTLISTVTVWSYLQLCLSNEKLLWWSFCTACPVGFFSFSVFAPKLLIVILWYGLHELHWISKVLDMYVWRGEEETDIANFFLKGRYRLLLPCKGIVWVPYAWVETTQWIPKISSGSNLKGQNTL